VEHEPGAVSSQEELPQSGSDLPKQGEEFMIPVAKCETLIRRPVAQVFEAFIDPAITCHFWYSRGSGRLEAGKKIRWDWEMYGVGTNVAVKAIDVNRRILIEWNGPENPSDVEWTFEPRDDRTWVTVENRGFSGTPEAQMKEALNSTQGFTFLLGGAKIWLEHGIEPRFVLDHSPDGLVEDWRHR
jgi:uncharacterized protein YndB with AHSA1/START domain